MANIKHKFVSNKADGADSTLIQASNWNDDHEITLTQASLLGATAAGGVQEITLGSGLQFNGSAIEATATGGGGVTSYNDLTDKPTLVTSYTQLTDLPTIPSTDGLAATDYVDSAISALVNGADAAYDTLKELQDAMATDAELSAAVAGLAATAFSGDYNDLTNKPTIPDVSGYATQADIDTAVAGISFEGATTFAATSSGQQALTLDGGERGSVDLTAIGSPTAVRVDADMDVFFNTSAASSGVIGTDLSADYTDAWRTISSQTELSGLDFGTGNFTLEFWAEPRGVNVNYDRLLFIGNVANTIKIQPIFFKEEGTNAVRTGLELKAGGATLKTPHTTTMPAITATGLMHVVYVVRRNVGKVYTYVNGQVVDIHEYVDDLSQPLGCAVGTNDHRVVVGGTASATPYYDGRIEDIKVYTDDLDAHAVQRRHEAGPNRSTGIDAFDASLSWWVDFVDAGWADPTKVECVPGYGDAVLNAVGTPTISEYAGGVPATSDDVRVLANTPETFIVGTDTTLNVFTSSLGEGKVRILPMVQV